MHASDCKEGWGDSQKSRNFTSFLLVLLIFFLMCSCMGLAVAMRAQCSVVEFICSSSLLHQYSGRKRWKQRMTEYHPQKSLSNNARSVVKSLPHLSGGHYQGQVNCEMSLAIKCFVWKQQKQKYIVNIFFLFWVNHNAVIWISYPKSCTLLLTPYEPPV